MSTNYINKVFNNIFIKNKNKPLFLQAVKEMFSSIEKLIYDFPDIEKYNILEQICEAERQYIFNVIWEDDKNNIVVNKGFRTCFSSILGPGKGGLRFHEQVNSDVINFLAFEQTFKNSLTGLQIGGSKGGSDFNPKGKSNREIMRFCKSFMTKLYHYIGPRVDVPAGDIGVGEREINYLFGNYKKITQTHETGSLTGKNSYFSGGSLIRKEATGYGCVYFAQEILNRYNISINDNKVAIVSGAGNVALYTIKKLIELGCKVVACSNSKGYLYDKNGLDYELLINIKEKLYLDINEYIKYYPSAIYKKGSKIWEVPCDFAFPCAIQNELDIEDAKILNKNGCKLVCEGANMPSTEEAIKYFKYKNILFAPGKAANLGGVAVSFMEMQQNASFDKWETDIVNNKLKNIMENVHNSCTKYMIQYNEPNNYILGANISGFLKLYYAIKAYGF